MTMPTTNPGALRAIVEIVAVQAAILRRDIDRVWDDQARSAEHRQTLAHGVSRGTHVRKDPQPQRGDRHGRLPRRGTSREAEKDAGRCFTQRRR